MKLESSPGFLKNPGSDSGLAFGGWGGGGGMITTVLRKPTKHYHHKSRFTRYLQYFRDVGPSHIVTNCTLDFANSTLGFARVFGENSKLVEGKIVFKKFCTVFKVLRSCRSPLLPTVL